MHRLSRRRRRRCDGGSRRQPKERLFRDSDEPEAAPSSKAAGLPVPVVVPPQAEPATADGRATARSALAGEAAPSLAAAAAPGPCAAAAEARLNSIPLRSLPPRQKKAGSVLHDIWFRAAAVAVVLGSGWIVGANTFDRTEEVRRLAVAAARHRSQARRGRKSRTHSAGSRSRGGENRSRGAEEERRRFGQGPRYATGRAGHDEGRSRYDAQRSRIDQDSATGGASRPRRVKAQYGRARPARRACRPRRTAGLVADADRLDSIRIQRLRLRRGPRLKKIPTLCPAKNQGQRSRDQRFRQTAMFFAMSMTASPSSKTAPVFTRSFPARCWPASGVSNSIERRGRRWVVVTSNGLIDSEPY